MTSEKFGRSWIFPAWLLSVVIALCAGAFAGNAPAAAAQAPVSGEFAARLGASNSFVGIVVGQGKVLAFVCNGTDANVSVWGWFSGDQTAGHTRLTSTTGLTLDLHFTGSDVSGIVTRPDGTFDTFQASPLPPDSIAGLYHAEGAVADGSFVGGWIVVEDLDVRGGVQVTPIGAGEAQTLGAGGFTAGNRTASISDGSSIKVVTPARITSDTIATVIG